MKKLILLLICLCVIEVNGQDHLISFAGIGASTEVSSVKIENLTTGISLIVNGNDILHLIAIKTGIKSIENDISSGLKIYPNPMTDNSIIEIFPRVKGNAVISLLDITGKPIARIQSYLDNSRQDFKLSGIKTGFYLINVEGDEYQYSGKLFSNGKSTGKVRIEKVSNNLLSDDEKYAKTDSKSIQKTVDMAYSSGDVLKFTGISDIYSTIKTDSPTQDKTITFNFIPCTDADSVNYPIVEIGNQVWMAENLGTTKYSNFTAIPKVTGNTEWSGLTTPGFCWYKNDESIYRAVYGALYNWYVLDASSNGGRNVCPIGWHVPTDAEWSYLTTYLGGESVAGIKLRETSLAHWLNPNTGTNESGFTAVSVGDRSSIGAFDILGNDGTWWTSTSNNKDNAWFRSIRHDLSNVNRSYYNKLNGFSIRCLKGDFKALPVLTTSSTDSINLTTAISGGNITSDGEDEIINRGVCWSRSPHPTTDSSKTSNGNGSGAFSSNLEGLEPGVQYFVRAYATNSVGTAYGNQMSFNTKISDVEGNTYNTVTIGNQVWMAENLKTIKLNDNNTIPNVTDKYEWSQLLIPAYCWLGNDSTQKDVSGALYNWHTVNTGKLCSKDWHVPTDTEWSTLTYYLGGESIAGDKLRETSSIYLQDSTIITYESGFGASPGGYRDHGPLTPGSPGAYFNAYEYSLWWSSTKSDANNIWYRQSSIDPAVSRDRLTATYGLSVRCLFGDAIPILNSTIVSSISQSSASIECSVVSDGGSEIISRGVCWSTIPNPTINENRTTEDGGLGTFLSKISGLTLGNVYYIRSYATNIIGTAYGTELTITTTPSVGDNYQGGIVAYILQPCDPGYVSGEIHGIIASPGDQIKGMLTGCYLMDIPDADGTAIGTGDQNTIAIMNVCGQGPAKYCSDLTIGGFSDWFLPSKDELNKLYLNRAAIGGFIYDVWWSSSVEGYPWIQSFSTGGQFQDVAYHVLFVRPIRSF